MNFEVKPWMWVLLIAVFLLAVTNLDPVGNAIERAFGEGADRWAINFIILAALVIAFLRGKRG